MGNSVFFMVILFIIIAVVWKGNLENRKKDHKIEKELRNQWKERREKVFSPYDMEQVSYLSKKSKSDNYIDDLTWNNLEMDKIYEKICYCSSTIGDEYFYHLLRNPIKDWKKLEELERKISDFSRDELTVLLGKEFVKLGKIKKYSMNRYLDYLMDQDRRSNVPHYLGIGILILSLCSMYYHVLLGILLFFATVIFQIMSYFKIKATIGPYLLSFSYLFRAVDTGKIIIPMLSEEWGEEKKRLTALFQRLKKIRKNSFLVMSHGSMWGQGLEFILDYIRMIFHLDIIKYNDMLEEIKKQEKEIFFLYETLGMVDACRSIACYRNVLSYWTVPEENKKQEMEFLEGYHPLLTEPVANSLKLSKGLLLTGSNASGKSTFLKMAGVNILLAQSIHTSHAKYFSIPTCTLMTCLAVRDSLTLSESYYVAEIKAVKRILDAAEKKEQIICMIDELLRGTNTRERIAAGAEILCEMKRRGILVLAATHDRELTRILENLLENYHFEEAVVKKELYFSYRLLPGRADTTNAISLLHYLGYDSKVVEGARTRLEIFQREGEWR